MDGDSWLSWIFVAALLCMAAYFAVAETAVTSVSRIRLRTRMERGEARAKKALFIQDHFDQAISAILIGTNIVHISTATLVTVLVTRRWGAGWVAGFGSSFASTFLMPRIRSWMKPILVMS